MIIKYGIIAAAWILFLILGFGGGNDADTNSVPESDTKPTITSTADSNVLISAEIAPFEIVAGEAGQYGREVTMSAGTDLEETLMVYYVPAGQYAVKNLGENSAQVSVYEGFAKNEETGYDEYTNAGDVIHLDADEEKVIDVPDGWFVEIQEPAHLSFTVQE